MYKLPAQHDTIAKSHIVPQLGGIKLNWTSEKHKYSKSNLAHWMYTVYYLDTV